MADSEGERNPFGRDVFLTKGSLLQYLSEIEKSFGCAGLVLSDMQS